MKGCIEHDDGKGKDKASIWVLEDGRVELTVTVCKTLHHSVNLLRFTWQPKTPQELSVVGRIGMDHVKLCHGVRAIARVILFVNSWQTWMKYGIEYCTVVSEY